MPVTERELIISDPLLLLLRSRLGSQHDIWIVFGCTAIAVLVQVGVPHYLGDRGWFTGDQPHLSTRLLLVVQSSMVTPGLVALYLWAPRATARLFRTLRANDVISLGGVASAKTFDTIDMCLRCIAGRPWWIPAVISSVIWFVYAVRIEYPHEYVQQLHSIYQNRQMWLAPVLMFESAVGPYIVTFCLLRLMVQVYLTRRLFRSCSVRVQLLHPDGVGGFGPVGAVVNRLFFFATGLGLVALIDGLVYWKNDLPAFEQPQWSFLVVVYLVLVPLLIETFLVLPARRMVEDRDRRLTPLSLKFNACLQAAADASLRSLGGAHALHARLRQLLDQYDLQHPHLPRWPIPITQVATAVLSILPLVIGVIGVVVHFLH